MTLSRCETITDEKKFLASHRAIIKAYEERKEKAHPAKREAIEKLLEPYKMRLEKYNQLKSNANT